MPSETPPCHIEWHCHSCLHNSIKWSCAWQLHAHVLVRASWACSWTFHEHRCSWKPHEHAHEGFTSTLTTLCNVCYVLTSSASTGFEMGLWLMLAIWKKIYLCFIVLVKPSWACLWGFHEHLCSWNVHEHAHEALTSTCAWSCHAHDHFIELCFQHATFKVSLKSGQ